MPKMMLLVCSATAALTAWMALPMMASAPAAAAPPVPPSLAFGLTRTWFRGLTSPRPASAAPMPPSLATWFHGLANPRPAAAPPPVPPSLAEWLYVFHTVLEFALGLLKLRGRYQHETVGTANPRTQMYVRHHAVSLLSLTLLSFGVWQQRLVHGPAGVLASLCLLAFHGGATLGFGLAWGQGAIPFAKLLLPHAPIALAFAAHAFAVCAGESSPQPAPWQLLGLPVTLAPALFRAAEAVAPSLLASLRSGDAFAWLGLTTIPGSTVATLAGGLFLTHALLEIGLGALKLRGRYAHEPPLDAPGGRGARGAMYVRHHGCALIALGALGLGLWADPFLHLAGGGRRYPAGLFFAPPGLDLLLSPFGLLAVACLLLLHVGAVGVFAHAWVSGAIPLKKVLLPHGPFALGFAVLALWQWAQHSN